VHIGFRFLAVYPRHPGGARRRRARRAPPPAGPRAHARALAHKRVCALFTPHAALVTASHGRARKLSPRPPPRGTPLSRLDSNARGYGSKRNRIKDIRIKCARRGREESARNSAPPSGPPTVTLGPRRCTRAIAELPGLDVELGRWQRLEARALSHRTQLRSEAP